jgi:hypothetical protein
MAEIEFYGNSFATASGYFVPGGSPVSLNEKLAIADP